jgi:lysozyme
MAETSIAVPSSGNRFAGAARKGKWPALALALICSWEGLKLIGWHDKIDPPGVNTVCYGHIEGVKVGDRYTAEQCKNMLLNDLPRYEAMVRKCVTAPMSDGTHAALLSFTFNVGGGALCKSSVAHKINAGDLQGGCDALLLYTRANGKFVQGLLNRRKDERRLCLS